MRWFLITNEMPTQSLYSSLSTHANVSEARLLINAQRGVRTFSLVTQPREDQAKSDTKYTDTGSELERLVFCQ
jgi:hypothetical protein